MSPEDYIAQWNRRLTEIERMLTKHNQDLYEGDGIRNPSITARLFRVEDSLKVLVSNSRWALRLVTGTLIVAIITAILHFVKP